MLTGDTKLVLPVSEVSVGLQKGKVAFTWGQIRGWLSPAPGGNINLPEDTVLVLPLKVVAPAFVAATGAKKRQSAQAVNQSLPDFFGPSAGTVPATAPAAEAPVPEAPAPVLRAPELPPAPAPVAEVAPVPAPTLVSEPAAPMTLKMEAPAPVVAEVPAAPAAPVAAPIAAPESAAQPSGSVPTSLAELFNQPGKADWAPNELVKLTCGLEGVIGAVVALEEGLVVAQKLPDGLSADTFAAFMPQIFSRLDKYTGEMQLGDTAEVTISTAGGPCRFFRRGKLFFATLGRSGDVLPAGLHLVAAELASQNS
jgi:predicted regulator of Ras-like GTPase activity (Roadblock/LC7/MglB family)